MNEEDFVFPNDIMMEDSDIVPIDSIEYPTFSSNRRKKSPS